MAKKDIKKNKIEEEFEDFGTRKIEILSPDEIDKKEVKPKPVKKEVKEEKKGNGVLATIVIFVLLVGVVAGSYYWYNEIYLKDTGKVNKVVNEKLGYSFVSYKSDKQLILLNDKYLIEYKDNVVYKVIDNEGKILFEDEAAFDRAFMDVNDNLYLVTDDHVDTGNLLSLYKLENGKFVLMKDYTDEGYNFSLITYEEDNKTYLYAISKVSHRVEGNTNVNSITLLDTEEEISLDAGIYFGNLNTDSFVTNSDRYLVVNNQDKVGLYDVKSKKLVVDYSYEKLDFINEDVMIVKKNNKYAILNMKLKKLVDYKYDYIEYKNDYILVGRDYKIGILDKEYKNIIGEVIPCEYGMSNVILNSHKVGTKIVVSVTDVNAEEAYSTYIVSGKDKIESIKEEFLYRNDFSYTVSNDNKKYTIYDKDLAKIGVIDLSDYDFENRVIITKVGSVYVLDGIYYDENLKQLDSMIEQEIKKDNYTLKVNTENTVSVLINGKSIGTYNYVYPNDLFKETEEGLFYYLSDNSYITIKKVNK